MGLFKKNRAACSRVIALCEDVGGAQTASELFDALPADLRLHAAACPHCREAAAHLVAARAVLSAVPSSADLAGPWFASRVMAAIAERKAELARTVNTWTFLPRLAAHLTWASSVALLLASAWLYQKPVSAPTPTARVVATDITGEPVADSTTLPNNDDVLVSLAEKPQ